MGRFSLVIFGVGVACLSAAAGCRSSASTASPYSTSSELPARDSLAAQQANARGLAHITAGEYEAAEKAFREALGYDIALGAAHNNLGLILLRQKRWYPASWEFAYAAKLQPQAAAPKGNLGLVFEAVGHYDQAIDAYESALAIDPDNVQVMGHLARTLVRAKDVTKQPRLRELLDKLSLRAEPDWSEWAREALIKLGTE